MYCLTSTLHTSHFPHLCVCVWLHLGESGAGSSFIEDRPSHKAKEILQGERSASEIGAPPITAFQN